MDKTEEKKQKNVSMRKPFRWRLFCRRLFRVLLFIIFLLILDLIFETAGFPCSAANFILSSLTRKGVTLHVDRLRAGLFAGIRADQVVWNDPEGGITAGAEKLYITPDWSVFLPGTGIPAGICVSGGYARIEEETEPLVLDKLRLDLVNQGHIRVIRCCTCTVNEVPMQLQGSVEHLFHAGLAELLDSFRRELLREQTVGCRWHPIMREILDVIRRQKFRSGMRCTGNLYIDCTSFRQCSGTIDIVTPPFDFGRVRMDSIRERIVIAGGLIHLKEMDLFFAGGSQLTLAGTIDSREGTASGHLEGRCRAEELLAMMGITGQQIRDSCVVFGKDPVQVKGTLNSFMFEESKMTGTVAMILPELRFRGIPMKNIRLELRSDEKGTSGILHEASLGFGGSISGTFRMAGGKRVFELEGHAAEGDFVKLLDKETAERVCAVVRPSSGGKGIVFKGTLEISDRGTPLSGDFLIGAEGLHVGDFLVERVSLRAFFTPDRIRMDDIRIHSAAGIYLCGNLLFRMDSSDLTASFTGTGSPRRILNAMQEKRRKEILKLTEGIVWPENEESVEVSTDLHYKFGSSSFSRLSGSIVMKDFSYRGIKFQSCAAQFILDENNTLILPAAILQSAQGNLALRAACSGENDPGLKKRGETPGTFHFELKSTLPGDDLITLFYPPWKRDGLIRFPDPVKLSASGSIDCNHPEKLHFKASVSNGSCLWNDMPLKDIDTDLECVGSRLSFTDAHADFCGGNLKADYTYDMDKEQGYINIDFDSGDLFQLYSCLGMDRILEKNGGAARWSAQAGMDFRYNKKDDLLLFGTAHIDLTGDDLWRFPVIGAFLNYVGKVWPIATAGSLRRIHVDGTFMNDTFTIDRMRTDGNVIALDGKGQYNWITTEYHARFQAELLRGALPFALASRILTPFSWILSKEYSGFYSDKMKPDGQKP